MFPFNCLHFLRINHISSQVVVLNCVCGFLSDRFGRRSLLLGASLVHVVASFLTALSAFTGSYSAFVAARFFVGGTIHAAWTATFVIVAEITHEAKMGVTGGVLNFGQSG